MWFVYSLFFAIWSAVSIFITKRLTKKFDPLPLLFTVFLFYLPSTFILLLLTGEIPAVTSNFYLYMLIAGGLDAAAFILSFNAISKSPISLVAPIQTFAPVITTLIAILALGETPTTVKFLGILLIVAGAYLLNVSEIKDGVLAPVKKLIADKGVQLSFLATLIWAITPIFQKKAILETSPQVPLFASVVGILFVTVIIAPFALKKTLKHLKDIPPSINLFLLCGIGGALSQLAAYTAFSLVNVGYASAVFRTSIFFVVLLGGIFLKEERLKERLIASGIMFAGILLIAL